MPEPDLPSEIKYELGIPLVEAVNETLTQTTALPTTEDLNVPATPGFSSIYLTIESIKRDDLPPKPPPRTFGIIDLNKPAYPVDSPKPVFGDKLKIKNTVFEFPETNSLDDSGGKTMDSPSILKVQQPLEGKKCHDLKLVSTPKNSTVGVGEGDGAVFKPSPTYELQKNMSESKISPTNSIVRAMIYSNKSKGAKKKNNITASKFYNYCYHYKYRQDNRLRG